MDYEQKYKGALERARKLYKEFLESDRTSMVDLETVFPELKESEDERIRTFLIDFIKVCGWTEKKDQGWPLREECIAWLEKQGEQKPAEWSEEDKENISTLIDLVEAKEESMEVKIELSTWLNSIKDRVRPQQEWSEEDEEILNTVINHFKVDMECTDEDDIISWLQSLRPQSHWKPSEAQMIELLNAGNGNILNGVQMQGLRDLYNELKKL